PPRGDRGEWRWASVDEALVAEPLSRPRQADTNALIAANEHLLDRTVDREIAGSRGRPFGKQRPPRRASCIASRCQEPPERHGIEVVEGRHSLDVLAVGRSAVLQLGERPCDVLGRRARRFVSEPTGKMAKLIPKSCSHDQREPALEAERPRMPTGD